jgi:recombinational DNA repair ATPase RecF
MSVAPGGVEPPWVLIADMHFQKQDLPRMKSTVDWLVDTMQTNVLPRHVFILGDTSHVRSAFSNLDTPNAIADFFRRIVGMKSMPIVHVLIGNHDMLNLKDRRVTSLDVWDIQPEQQIKIYREPTCISVDGRAVVMMPYHHDQQEIVQYIEQLHQVLGEPGGGARLFPGCASVMSLEDVTFMGHLAVHGAIINGFQDQSNIPYRGGDITVRMLRQFKRVFTGHFHRHATYGGTVTYVGSPMQQNFGDVGDDARGMVIYRPREDNFELLKNPHAVYFVSEKLSAFVEAGTNPPEEFQRKFLNKCVRIVVPPRFDQRAFNDAVDQVMKFGAKGYCKHAPKLKAAFELRDVAGGAPGDAEDGEEDDDDGMLVERKDDVDDEDDDDADLVPGAAAAASAPRAAQKAEVVEDFSFDIGKLVPEFVDLASDREMSKTRSLQHALRDDDPEVIARKAKVDFMLQIIADVVDKRIQHNQPASVNQQVHHRFDADVITMELHNFMGVRGTRTIHFDKMPDGVTFVSGNNGAGKSTLPEALTWCLWGETLRPDMKAADVVNDTPDSKDTACRVSVSFRNGYRIVRERMEKRKNPLTLCIIGPDGSKIEKAKVKDTELEIQNLLGIDFATYVRTILLSSTTTLNFINSDDKSKRAIIELLLGCDKFAEFDDAVKAEKKRIEQRRSAFQSDVQKIEHEKSIKQNDLANCASRIATKSTAIKTAQARIAALRSKIAADESRRGQVDQLRTKALEALEALKVDKVAVEADISELNNRVVVLQAVARAMKEVDVETEGVNTEKSKEHSASEQLRMLQRKGTLEKVIDAAKEIREVHLKALGFSNQVLMVSSKLQDEVIVPLEAFAKVGPSKTGQQIAELQASITAAQQKGLNHAAAVPTKTAALTKLLEMHEKSLSKEGTASTGSKQCAAQIVTLQKLVTQANQKKPALTAAIAAATSNLPPLAVELAKQIEADTESIKAAECSIVVMQSDIAAEVSMQDLVKPSILACDQRIRELTETKGAEIEKALEIVLFWAAALCPGKLKQVNGFRSFCLGKQMEQVNSLMQSNIDILCEDMHGVVDAVGARLSCKLTENLQVVEANGGITIAKRSEGQRKRTHLAIFLALFTIALRRLPFRASLLFLDEVFDNLDEAGQVAVQKWVAHLMKIPNSPIKKAFVITHSNIRFQTSKGSNTLVVAMDRTSGTQYYLADFSRNAEVFVSSLKPSASLQAEASKGLMAETLRKQSRRVGAEAGGPLAASSKSFAASASDQRKRKDALAGEEDDEAPGAKRARASVRAGK